MPGVLCSNHNSSLPVGLSEFASLWVGIRTHPRFTTQPARIRELHSTVVGLAPLLPRPRRVDTHDLSALPGREPRPGRRVRAVQCRVVRGRADSVVGDFARADDRADSHTVEAATGQQAFARRTGPDSGFHGEPRTVHRHRCAAYGAFRRDPGSVNTS